MTTQRKSAQARTRINSSLHPQIYFTCTHTVSSLHLAGDMILLMFSCGVLNYIMNREIIREQTKTGWKVEKGGFSCFVFIYINGYVHWVIFVHTMQMLRTILRVPTERTRVPSRQGPHYLLSYKCTNTAQWKSPLPWLQSSRKKNWTITKYTYQIILDKFSVYVQNKFSLKIWFICK